MTYDWNKQVEITVPTGTNGWIYSGEVIINGVKVRFPVGVATTVPEPAAALLNKMIELEREDDLSGAKPNNHYVGNVTVPDGKTLTLQKGAKVVDEAGVLGGSSAPAPVVILPETELTYSESDSAFGAVDAVQMNPEEGKTYVVTYNGTAYDCLCRVMEPDHGVYWYLMGNVAAINPDLEGDADAPFAVMMQASEGTATTIGCIPMDGATSVTLSIVEAAKTESAGGGGGLFIVNVTSSTAMEESILPNYPNAWFVELDKTFAETKAAFESGQRVECRQDTDGIISVFPIVEVTEQGITFSSYYMGSEVVIMMVADGTAHMFASD